jgi:hypothetical protein
VIFKNVPKIKYQKSKNGRVSLCLIKYLFLGTFPLHRFIHIRIIVQNKGIPSTKCTEFNFHSYCIGLMMALHS